MRKIAQPICTIETPDCIYEFIQGPVGKEYEDGLYDALARSVYENYFCGK